MLIEELFLSVTFQLNRGQRQRAQPEHKNRIVTGTSSPRNSNENRRRAIPVVLFYL